MLTTLPDDTHAQMDDAPHGAIDQLFFKGVALSTRARSTA